MNNQAAFGRDDVMRAHEQTTRIDHSSVFVGVLLLGQGGLDRLVERIASNALWSIPGILILTFIGWLANRYIQKTRKEAQEAACDADEMLAEFRSAYRKGQMSEEEYQRITRILRAQGANVKEVSAKLATSMTVESQPASSLGETSEVVEQPINRTALANPPHPLSDRELDVPALANNPSPKPEVEEADGPGSDASSQ